MKERYLPNALMYIPMIERFLTLKENELYILMQNDLKDVVR